MVGEKLGRYEIRSEIGRGAMGVVYKAFDPNLERHVAIKFMSPDTELDEERRARFLIEARSAARLITPNIVAVHEMGEDKNRPYIVMEYVDGRDLKEIIDARIFISFEKKLKIVRQICRGLDYAHNNHVIHRDVKPSNVLLRTDGEAKIMDFGLARLASSEWTREGRPLGSPYYMSPEQVIGKIDIDGRSDQFSIGVLLYEFISYSRPFEAETPTTVIFKISTGSHPPISEVFPGCSESLVGIIERTLEKDADDRFANCEELAQALREFELRLADESMALTVELSSVEKKLSELRNEIDVVDDTIFNTAQFLRDPKSPFSFTDFQEQTGDYGYLLLRHADLVTRIKVLELIEVARSQFDDKELETCLKTLDKIHQSHPGNRDARALEQQCRNLLEEQRREREHQLRLSTALAVARNALNREDLQRCLQAASAALEIDPAHEEAQLLKLESERRQRLEELVDKAQECSEADKFETCLQLISEGLGLEPEHSKLKELQQTVEAAWERQREFEDYLEEACLKLEAKAYEDVVVAADNALTRYPEESRAQELKDEAIRAMEQLNELLTTARQLKARQEYEACFKTIKRGLELDPRHTELRKLQLSVEKAWERQLEIDGYLEEAHRQLDAKAYEDAIETVDRVLSLHPDVPQARELKDKAVLALEQLNELVELANQQWERKEYEACLETVRKALVLDPRHGELKKLQRSVQVEVDRRRKIERLMEEAQRYLDEKAFGKAVEASNKVLELDPEDSRALSCKATAVRQREIAEEHEAQIKQLLDYARQQVNTRNFNSAVRNLSFLLQLEPDHDDANQLLTRIQNRSDSTNLPTAPQANSEKDTASGAEREEISIPDVETVGAIKEPENIAAQETWVLDKKTLSEEMEKRRFQTAGKEVAEKFRLSPGKLFKYVRELQVFSAVRLWSTKISSQVVNGLSAIGSGAKKRPMTATMIIGLPLLAILVAGAILIYYPEPEAVPLTPPPPGTVFLKISPWAKIDSIISLADGEEMQFSRRTTPCRIELPGGSYRILASNPPLGQILELQVTVVEGMSTEVTKMFPHVDLDEVIEAELDKMR